MGPVLDSERNHFLIPTSTPIFRFFPSGNVINCRRARKPRLISGFMLQLVPHLKSFVQN